LAKDNFTLNEIIKRLEKKGRDGKTLKMLSEIICVELEVPTQKKNRKEDALN